MPTHAESILWMQLRAGWMDGYRFRRQHAIGRFILDLYCAERKLAIELDGAHHDEAEQRMRDEARTAALERAGIRVLRFRNAEVLNDLADVVKRIAEALGPRDKDAAST
jgi:very-short-patch-repair endonuclease